MKVGFKATAGCEAEAFWSKVDKNGPVPENRPSLGPCWIWKAALHSAGYGVSWWHKRLVGAHRISYELFFGAVPRGLEPDHLCRIRPCVNPHHLEAVTRKVNNARGFSPSAINSRKTHCGQGHRLAGRNVYKNTNVSGSHRTCRACHRKRVREEYHKKEGRMPRICNLMGCGNPIVNKAGNADYRKHWCSRECKNSDSREKMAARRKVVHGRKCRLCGRKALAATPLLVGVSQDTTPPLSEAGRHEEFLDANIRLRSERPETEIAEGSIGMPEHLRG